MPYVCDETSYPVGLRTPCINDKTHNPQGHERRMSVYDRTHNPVGLRTLHVVCVDDNVHID